MSLMCYRKTCHVSTYCPIKRNAHSALQIWVPKGTRPPNVIDTNPYEPIFFKYDFRKV